MLQSVYYVDSSDQNVTAWNWTFTGGTPANAVGKGPHKVSYNTPGLKSTTLSINNFGGGTQTYTQNNLIYIGTDTFTKAQFVYGYYGQNRVGFQNTSIGSQMQYKWYFGDGDSSSEKDPIHVYSNANNKVVKLLVNGQCGAHDTTITLRDFTVLKTDKIEFCKLYPNPANKAFCIKSTDAPDAQYEVQVLDMTGRRLLNIRVVSSELISTQALAPGQYLVSIRNGQQTLVEKLVISHD
jgi:hypothetical protein